MRRAKPNSSSSSRSISQASTTKKTKKCQHCSLTLLATNMTRHLKKSHPDFYKPRPHAVRLERCDVCNKTFNYNHRRRDHWDKVLTPSSAPKERLIYRISLCNDPHYDHSEIQHQRPVYWQSIFAVRYSPLIPSAPLYTIPPGIVFL